MLNDRIVYYQGRLGLLCPASGKGRKDGFVFKPCDAKYYNSGSDPLVDFNYVEETDFDIQCYYLRKTFVWGKIINIYTIGDYQIIEYISDKDETLFHIYINFSDTNWSVRTLDQALVAAIAYKQEGPNSSAHRYFFKMLDMV